MSEEPAAGPDCCPAPAACVRAVYVEHEAVLVDEQHGHVQVLNPSGTLVWRCLDGASTVGEICTDVADALSAPIEVVLDDTVRLINSLVDSGMVTTSDRARVAPCEGHREGTEPRNPAAQRASTALGASFGDAPFTRVVWHRGIADVRTNDRVLRATLESLNMPLRGSEGLDDRRHRQKLSLFVEPPSGNLIRLHTLYRDDEHVFHCADLGRAVQALFAEIASSALAHSPGLVPVRGRALSRGGDAVLVLASEHSLLDLPERGLARVGWTAIDAPLALDRSTRELVVPDQPGSFDDFLPERMLDRRDTDPDFALAGDEDRFRVRAAVLLGYEPERTVQLSSASRLVMLVPFVAGDSSVAADDVEMLLRLMQTVQFFWVTGFEPDDVLQVFRHLDTPDQSAKGAPE